MEPRPSSPPPNGVANAPEPRSSSPPPNGVANAPEPRSSSPPPNGVANAPEQQRSSSPPPQPHGESNARQPRPATPPPQDGFIDLGPRSFPLFPRVKPHANGPLSSSPPFPSDEPHATEPKAAEPDATEPRATDHRLRHGHPTEHFRRRSKSVPEWRFKIPRESLDPDASHEVFMAAWRQSATPRGLLRKVDREEVRLLKMARVRAALRTMEVRHDAKASEWCRKSVEVVQVYNKYIHPRGGVKDKDGGDRLLGDLMTFAYDDHPLIRPVAIFETEGRVHAIYVQFIFYGGERDSDDDGVMWRSRNWRISIDFGSDGLFKRIELAIMASITTPRHGNMEELMKTADQVQELLNDNPIY